ncbi:MAG: hypothetical protein QOI90_1901, partial [Mycobacterium sp.]|nr:hypothetical protein [Mycobacterium sp.]
MGQPESTKATTRSTVLLTPVEV